MTADSPVQDTTLALVAQDCVNKGRELDTLGVYWMAGPCVCGDFSAGTSGWSVVTVRPGLQLHWCSDCGRTARPNREQVLGAEPWAKGDVAVLAGQLVTLSSAPGPTGAVHVVMLDGYTTTTHVALLNLEDA